MSGSPRSSRTTSGRHWSLGFEHPASHRAEAIVIVDEAHAQPHRVTLLTPGAGRVSAGSDRVSDNADDHHPRQERPCEA